MPLAELAIHTDGAVSCRTVLWRFRGCLQLTVVVKAVFAIVHEGIATPVGPGEIVVADRPFDGSPRSSIEVASDLAPLLHHCDVLFTGHAHALGRPVPTSAARIRLSRYGRWMFDKTIHVYGDRGPTGMPKPFLRMPIVYERALGGPGSSNPAGTMTPNLADPTDARRPAGFGPISRLWPARSLLLGPIDARSIEGPVPDIPDALSVAYFQAAPQDQQIDPLRGGEWLVLEGLDPERWRLETWLPAARGAVRVLRCRPGAPEAEIPMELACDTLAIDGDRRTFSLTWRGRCALAEGEAVLPSLMVLAALNVPGGTVDWEKIRPTAAFEASLGAASHLFQQATAVMPSGAALMPKAVLPFGFFTVQEELPRRPSSPSFPHLSTMKLGPSELGAIRSKAALPFEPSGEPARPPSTDATPWSEEPLRPVPVADPHLATSKVPVTPFGLGMRLASAPLSRPPPPPSMPPWPMPPLEEDDDIDTLQGIEPVTPESVTAVPAVELPPRVRSQPPPADPWAQPFVPEAEPSRPTPPAPQTTFERPAAAAVKESFYSKFGRKRGQWA